jgi:AcrR family transcriptional regulator
MPPLDGKLGKPAMLERSLMAVAKKKVGSVNRDLADRSTPRGRPASKKISRTQEERNARARQSMCKAALELFALQGYHATALPDVSLRAGYSRGLVYHHFNNKEALAELLLDELSRRDTHMQMLQLTSTTTGAEAWQSLEQHRESSWQHFCDLHFEHGHDLVERGALVLRIEAAHSPDPALRLKTSTIGAELTKLVESALSLCARDGVIRDNLDVKSAALYYIGAIGGMAQMLQLRLVEKSAANAVIEPLRGYMNSLLKDPDIRNR